MICLPNFSSIGQLSFSSAVNSCYWLLTADDRCYDRKSNEIFIYVLKMKCVPNFRSLG